MENSTHKPMHASITLRGKTVSFRQWNLSDVAQHRDDFVAISGCPDLLARDTFPHVLRILARTIKDYFPRVPLERLMDDLADAITPADLMNIVPVVFNPNAPIPYLHEEASHGIH